MYLYFYIKFYFLKNISKDDAGMTGNTITNQA